MFGWNCNVYIYINYIDGIFLKIIINHGNVTVWYRKTCDSW